MKLSVCIVWCAFSLLAGVQGQVPPIINYQGSVAVGGANYQGTGYFKFALVSGDGTRTFWSNDGTSATGNEPTAWLPLAVSGGLYDVALGDTVLTNMQPVPAAVFANSEVHLRVWFSDGGTPFQRVVPDQRLTAVGYAMMAADVAAGAVTADKLADGAVTTAKLAPYAVTAVNVAPGAIGPAQLAPNAAATSLQASGGLVLSDQANATNLLRAGFQSVGTVLARSDQWQTFGAGLFGPDPRANAAAIWTGKEMIIVGGSGLPASLPLGTGARYDPAADAWKPIATNKYLAANGSISPKAVWTGSEMVVLWGYYSIGSNFTATAGGIYNPQTDFWRNLTLTNASIINASSSQILWTGREVLVWRNDGPSLRFDPIQGVWKAISTQNAPATGYYRTAVWTGQELIVWGGTALRDGARYDPLSDTWKPMTRLNAPKARFNHSAVWTGKQMLVWGGYFNLPQTTADPGGAYDPASDTWKPMGTLNQPSPRENHLAFWTGSQMIIWGGQDLNGKYLSTGGRYNPATDTWASLATQGTPGALAGYAAVWADQEMIVWGGKVAKSAFDFNSQAILANSGARYHPDQDVWQPMVTVPTGRLGHSAVWTGHELLVWGGRPVESATTRSVLLSGARSDPLSHRWSAMSSANAPSARQNHQAVWTGKEMIIWGGEGYGPSPNEPTVQTFGPLGSGGRYDPATDTWTAMETNGAPMSRTGHTMVWSGEEAIIFGGYTLANFSQTNYLNSGARYNPEFDSWTTLPSDQAPSARQRHFAVWTGKDMLIWGGQSSVSNNQVRFLNNGARYDPAASEWSPISTNGAPATWANGSAVWTGREMLVLTRSSPSALLISGGRYDPVADRWEPVSASGAPGAFLMTSDYSTFTVVWSGHEALVWGSLTPANGVRYDPGFDVWTPMTTLDAPKNRRGHAAIWTGNAMLVFGGVETPGASVLPNTILNYSLSRPLYLYRHP